MLFIKNFSKKYSFRVTGWLILFCFMYVFSSAQTPVTLGLSGETFSNQQPDGQINLSPITPYEVNMRYRFMYTKDELNSKGIFSNNDKAIIAFGFYVEQAPFNVLKDYTVKMYHTAGNKESGDPSPLPGAYLKTVIQPFNYMPKVRQPNNFLPQTNIYDTLRFNPADYFVWNGVDNIMVDICFTNVDSASRSGVLRQYNARDAGCALSPSSNACDMPTNPSLYRWWTPQCVLLFSSYQADVEPLWITSQLKPFAHGLQDVNVVIRNNSCLAQALNKTLTSATINWSVNGVVQAPFNWTGSLQSEDISSPITIGQYDFQIKTKYTLKIWTTSPNGQPDAMNRNDTIVIDPLYAAYCGNYTIGRTDPDFENPGEAFNWLGLGGVSCPAVFNIRPGKPLTYDDYTGPYGLQEIAGASETNTITFRSENGIADSVWITCADPQCLLLEGTDWARFENITIYNRGFGPFSQVAPQGKVMMMNMGANHNVFSEVTFRGPLLTYGDALARSTGDNNYNTFIRDSFIGGGGISMGNYVVEPPYQKGNRIIDNVFVEGGSSFMDLLSQEAVYISGNTCIAEYVPSTPNGTHLTEGINLVAGKGKNIITNNKISIANGKPLYVLADTYTPGDTTLITDNFLAVTDGSLSGGGPAVEIYRCFNLQMYHNSVRAKNQYAIQVGQGNGIELKNNIFANTANAGSVIYYLADSASFKSDYNDFYADPAPVSQWGGIKTNTLAEWQLKSGGQDQHSVSIDPGFNSASDLHLFNASLDGKGIPLAGVTKDIDGQPRNMSTPDIGADEFTIGYDGGVVCFDNPLDGQDVPMGQDYEVKVCVSNIGSYPLSGFNVGYTVNGGQLNQEAFNSVLNVGEDTIFTFIDHPWHPDAAGFYTICAKTILPVDVNASNDEYCITVRAYDALSVSSVNKNVRIYPNPGTGMYHLTIGEENSQDFRILVRNTIGMSVKEEQLLNAFTGYSTDIDLSAYPDGIYLVQVAGPQGTSWIKLIKQ